MTNISMLTVVPYKMAADLCHNRVLKNFNTLPKVNKTLLETVREYMRDNVGYENLPMACLSATKSESNSNIADVIQQYLPINAKDSILFQLDMPEDMIITMNFHKLLEYSAELDRTSDEEMISFIKDDIADELSIGIPKNSADYIFFIPFLAADKCKFYAKFNDAFAAEELNLPGIEHMPITKLSAFYK